MWNKTKSLYDTDAAYWYSQYEEQFLFEKGNLESQLAAARKRKGDDIFELRMYGGILAALVLLVPLEAVFMLAGGLVLSIVAAVGLFILIAGYTIALPVVCYKLVKGSFLYLVYHNRNFAAFLKNKYQISNINHEIFALQKRLQEFEAYEKKLDVWKMQLEDGMTGQQLLSYRQYFEQIDYGLPIAIIEGSKGGLQSLTKKVAWIGGILLWLLLVSLVVKVLLWISGGIAAIFGQL